MGCPLMELLMIRFSTNQQVGITIIHLIAVDMMNTLVAPQRTAKDFFGYQNMFGPIPTTTLSDAPIGTGIRNAPLPQGMILTC